MGMGSATTTESTYTEGTLMIDAYEPGDKKMVWRGTEVAAIFYTLFETAKLSGVNPRDYVTLAANRAVADHGAVTLPSDLT
jgi:hypothetical protein